MVFMLRHVETGERVLLGVNKTYTLGRSRRHNILLRDATVNVLHAIVVVNDVDVSIEDKDSEYGTWVNKRRISEKTELKNGDIIVFGKNNCKYVFLNPEFEAELDKNMPKSTRRMLEQTLKELNVSLSQNYSNSCTHYVIESISLDRLKEKTVLYYLIDRKIVITSKYFIDILTDIEDAPSFPNVFRYMPEIDSHLKDKGIEDIKPRQNRRYIFDNAVFIFFDKTCQENLCDLIIKCGGDLLWYNQKKDFFNELFKDINKFEYIAVKSDINTKEPPEMYCFLRCMKSLNKKVVQMGVDDIYISILKGCLEVSKKNPFEENGIEENQPSTSNVECTSMSTTSQDGNSEQSDLINIVGLVVKKPDLDKRPLNTFRRLATAYKEEKTLNEVVLNNHASSFTLNRWVTRFKQQEASQTISGNRVTRSQVYAKDVQKGENKNNGHSSKRLENRLTDGESQDGLESDVGPTREVTDITIRYCEIPKSKKKYKRILNKELDDCPADKQGDGSEKNVGRSRPKKNNKKRNFVFNPFAAPSTPKPIKEKYAVRSSTLQDWLKKYKNVEIIPMT